MNKEREENFNSVVYAIFFKRKLAVCEEIPLSPSKSHKFLVYDGITGICFYVEESMTKLWLKKLMVQYEKVDTVCRPDWSR